MDARGFAQMGSIFYVFSKYPLCLTSSILKPYNVTHIDFKEDKLCTTDF
jgi:hypothetical protein